MIYPILDGDGKCACAVEHYIRTVKYHGISHAIYGKNTTGSISSIG